ncbi:MAG: hypothetical protein ABI679_11075 [Gemmatimonadota bacterium]
MSMPDGVLRALRDKRLPSHAQVWDTRREEWVSLAAHPGIMGLLQSISAHTTQVDQALPKPARALSFANAARAKKAAAVSSIATELVPAPESVAEEEPDSPIHAVATHDLDQIPELIEMELPSAAELLEETPSAKEPVRPLPDVMTNEKIMDLGDIAPRAIPAEAAAPAISPAVAVHEIPKAVTTSPAPAPAREAPSSPEPAYPLDIKKAKSRKPVPVSSPPRSRTRLPLVAIAATVLVLAIAGGSYFWYQARPTRSTPVSAQGATPMVVPSSPADAIVDTLGSRPVRDSASQLTQVKGPAAPLPALPLQGVSGAGPEPDLEIRLRLANAVAWVPSEDFGSTQALLLSRRKVEAAQNSFNAFRVDMNRLPDSAKVQSDYRRRVEPFAEAQRVDEVLAIVGTAVEMLDSLSGRFQVNGRTVNFNRPDDAVQFGMLLRRADSLLTAPVELDPYPTVIRAPRRAVNRLVQSLPRPGP